MPDGQDFETRRRRFLAWLFGVANSAIGAALVGPFTGLLAAPLAGRKSGNWISVLPARALKDGETEAVELKLQEEPGKSFQLFVSLRDGEFQVLDATCSHLGCIVAFDSTDGHFKCPCHGGHYDEFGEVVAGPPPEPLRVYDTKVEQGMLWILFDEA